MSISPSSILGKQPEFLFVGRWMFLWRRMGGWRVSFLSWVCCATRLPTVGLRSADWPDTPPFNTHSDIVLWNDQPLLSEIKHRESVGRSPGMPSLITCISLRQITPVRSPSWDHSVTGLTYALQHRNFLKRPPPVTTLHPALKRIVNFTLT